MSKYELQIIALGRTSQGINSLVSLYSQTRQPDSIYRPRVGQPAVMLMYHEITRSQVADLGAVAALALVDTIDTITTSLSRGVQEMP